MLRGRMTEDRDVIKARMYTCSFYTRHLREVHKNRSATTHKKTRRDVYLDPLTTSNINGIFQASSSLFESHHGNCAQDFNVSRKDDVVRESGRMIEGDEGDCLRVFEVSKPDVQILRCRHIDCAA